MDNSSAFESLLVGLEMDSENFLNEIWEKQPYLFKSKTNQGTIHFSKNQFLHLLKTESITNHVNNFTAVKYVKNRKVNYSFDSSTQIHLHDKVTNTFNNGYTVQFFQPQRYCDSLHQLMASLESTVGTLVGSSAYITPPFAQGLAPHYDDVEVFIIHVEGKKRWHLWKNTAFPLPEDYSSDLERNSLSSENFQEIDLNPGDILYMPRGTIHEAIAQDDFTTHITLSLYQKYNYKTFFLSLIPKLLSQAFLNDITYRRGLPICMQQVLGSYPGQCIDNLHRALTKVNTENNSDKKSDGMARTNISQVASDFNRQIFNREELLSHLRTLFNGLSLILTDSIIDEAADELYQDFTRNRLPPANVSITTQKMVDVPSRVHNLASGTHVSQAEKRTRLRILKSKKKRVRQPIILQQSDRIALTFTGYQHYEIVEIEGVKTFAVHHSAINSRLTHMGHPLESFGLTETIQNKYLSKCSRHRLHSSNSNKAVGNNVIISTSPLLFPIRLAPIVTTLQQHQYIRAFIPTREERSHGGIGQSVEAGISVKELVDVVALFRIFPDEVASTVTRLIEAGFAQII